MAKFSPLTPYSWPQDTLRIPNGHGLMPRIDFENGYNTGREGAVYTMALLGVLPGQRDETVTPVEADADFWVSEICTYTSQVGDNAAFDSPTGLLTQIIDVRTDFNMTHPYIRHNLFGVGTLTRPGSSVLNSAPCRSTLTQPYCFTRNGGIRVITKDDRLSGPPLNVWFSFIGWKEYSYAST